MVLLSTMHIISIFRRLHVGKSICFGLILYASSLPVCPLIYCICITLDYT